jgi:hypothetical protein
VTDVFEWWRRLAAVFSLFGGVLYVISRIPPSWYGYASGDSYVFDPTVFSPIWIERELMPMLALVGTIGLICGFGALVYRDWEANRLFRVSGVLSVAGVSTFILGLYGPELLAPANTQVGPISGLAGLALALWGGLLLLVGGPLVAYSYIKADRARLGWSLLGFVPAGVILGALVPGGFGQLISTVPLLFLAGVMAWELEFGRAITVEVTGS